MNRFDWRATRQLVSICVALPIAGVGATAYAADKAWVAETIADAVQAAPPSVTANASIYGWSPDGELVLARYGSGSYTCIASGSFSIRVGKPALPYRDPMCLDRNAWSFIQALWSGSKPLPSEPGLVWMLAGMNVSRSAVDIGAASLSVDKAKADAERDGIVQMTPHVMVLPLPFSEQQAAMATAYALDHPLNAWIMAAGKPHEHLMVHFTAQDVNALMAPGN